MSTSNIDGEVDPMPSQSVIRRSRTDTHAGRVNGFLKRIGCIRGSLPNGFGIGIQESPVALVAALAFAGFLAPAFAQEDQSEPTAANSGTTERVSCRVRYDGPQPQVAIPPAYIVDAPLPTVYCDDAGQWLFFYITPKTVQFYRLDPGRHESYRTLFTAAARGEMAPWALLASRSGKATYYFNTNPAVDATFDYSIVAGKLNLCAELAVQSVVKTAAATEVGKCRGSSGDTYADSRGEDQ